MTGQGHRIFVDKLARFAAVAADPRVTSTAKRVACPLRVAVCGRSGVGRRTVAHALDRAGLASGITVTAPTDPADVTVYVMAEVVKPEDRDAVAASQHPVVAVLNKADVVGLPTSSPAGGEIPAARAQRARCARFSELIGVSMEPMSGLLAVAALDDLLDDALWAALRAVAARPDAFPDASVDGFAAAAHPLPAAVRLRLLDTLDLFGIALGVAAVRQGRAAPQLRILLRRVSRVDAVVDKVTAAGAEVRYRRVQEAVAELETLAVTNGHISEFLCRDDTVIARMAAAEEMAEAVGIQVAAPNDPAGHLLRASWWQRYSRGPVSALYRTCGADIARGSLRLWSQGGGCRPGQSDSAGEAQ